MQKINPRFYRIGQLVPALARALQAHFFYGKSMFCADPGFLYYYTKGDEHIFQCAPFTVSICISTQSETLF